MIELYIELFLGFMFLGLLAIGGCSYMIYIYLNPFVKCDLCEEEKQGCTHIKEVGNFCPVCLQDAKDLGFVRDNNTRASRKEFSTHLKDMKDD